MPFDPKAYIAEQKAPGFDPAAYLAEAKGSAKPESRAAQAGLESYGNTATLGYLPQLQAMAEPITDQILNPFNVGGVNAPIKQALGIGAEYVDARDKNIRRGQELSEAHPTASAVGTAAGIGASLLVPGAAVAKGAGVAAKIGAGAKSGAIYGAAMNPGDTEGEIDPLQLTDRGKNSAIGGTIGAITAGTLATAGPIARKASEYFGTKAEEKAVGTIADKGATKLIKKEGQTKSLGRMMLDQGIVTPFASAKKILQRIKDRIDPTEEKLTALIADAESSIGKTEFWNSLPAEHQEKLFSSLFNPKQTAERLKGEILKRYNQIPREKIQPVLDEIDVWYAKRGEVMSPSEVQGAKVQMNRFLKDTDFSREVGPVKEGTKTARRGFREGVEKTADTLAEIKGKEGGEIKATNQTLGNLYKLEKIGENRVAGIDSNRSVSLTDYLAAATAGPLGVPAQIAAAGANKLGRTFGKSLQATGYNAVSKGLASGPAVTAFAQKHPTAYLTLLNALGGGPEFKETGADVLNDQKILGIFRSNPGLIDSVTDSRLRDKLKSVIGRDPADNAMKRRLSK